MLSALILLRELPMHVRPVPVGLMWLQAPGSVLALDRPLGHAPTRTATVVAQQHRARNRKVREDAAAHRV